MRLTLVLAFWIFFRYQISSEEANNTTIAHYESDLYEELYNIKVIGASIQNQWISSYGAQNTEFTDMIIQMPHAALYFENVTFHNIHVISTQDEPSECMFTCVACTFDTSFNKSQNHSEILFHNCSQAKVYLTSTVLISTCFLIYSHSVIEAYIFDTIMQGTENVTGSGSQILFIQTDNSALRPGSLVANIHIEEMICDNNVLSMESPHINAIIMFKVFRPPKGILNVSLVNINCTESSQFLDFNLVGLDKNEPAFDNNILTLKNVTLSSNTGRSNIMRIFSTSAISVNISDSLFQENVIYSDYNEHVEKDYFENPIAKTGTININGTMVMIKIENCTFTENSGRMGGALSILSNGLQLSKVEIKQCNFINNSVSKTDFQEEGKGGSAWILYNFLQVWIHECSFSGNMADTAGGGLYVSSMTQIINWWPDYRLLLPTVTTPSQSATTHAPNRGFPSAPTSIDKPENKLPQHTQGSTVPPRSSSTGAQTGVSTTPASATPWPDTADDDDDDDNDGSDKEGGEDHNKQVMEVFCLKGLPGPKGAKGEPGPAGHAGPSGPGGPVGPPGYKGMQGATGYTGQSETARHLSKRNIVIKYNKSNDGDSSDWSKSKTDYRKIAGPYKDIKEINNFDSYNRKKRDTQSIVTTLCPDYLVGHECVRGPTGPKGYKGYQGGPGLTGPPGHSGFTGPRGVPGPDGKTGATGPSSKNIVKRQSGNIDYELEKITSNSDCPKGDRGPWGDWGDQGPRGPSGVPGGIGASGPPGEPGSAGSTGMAGGQGELWPIGKPGLSPLVLDRKNPDTLISKFERGYLDITISNTTFTENIVRLPNGTRADAGGGGAVSFRNLYGIIFLDTIGSRFIANESPHGGALEVRGFAITIANITECLFQYNRAGFSTYYGSGGAVYVNQEIEILVLNSTDFLKNSAYSDGGGVCIHAAKIRHMLVDNCNFSENDGQWYGGALFITRPYTYQTPTFNGTFHKIKLITCNFLSNTAASGGAFGYNVNSGGHYSDINLIISVSEFRGNHATNQAGAMHVSLSQEKPGSKGKNIISLETITFMSNYALSGGAFLVTFSSYSFDLVILESLFHKNSASSQGGALQILSVGCNYNSNNHYHVFLIIQQSSFEQNYLYENVVFNTGGTLQGGDMVMHTGNGIKQGGAIFMQIIDQCYAPVEIKLSTLEITRSHGARVQGSGIYLNIRQWMSTILCEDSQFLENLAGKTGYGGGLYLTINDKSCEENSQNKFCDTSKILFDNTTFIDNTAFEGGSIYQSGENLDSRLTVVIQYSRFSCCQEVEKVASNSTLMHFSIAGELHEVSFYEYSDKMAGLCPTPGVVFDEQERGLVFSNVQFFCKESDIYLNVGPSIHNTSLSSKIPVQSLMSFCTDCQFDPYIFGNGLMMVSNESGAENLRIKYRYDIYYRKLSNPCQACPYGGVCKYKITSRPNYWGYIKGGKHFFHGCPVDYCCNDIEVLCEQYDTCALHREGRLCGRCKKGYTESLMSRTCVPNEECNDWWVFVGAVFVALTYLLWYMYKSEIVPCLTFILQKISSHKTRRDNLVHVAPMEENKEKEVPDEGNETKKKIMPESSPPTRVDKGYFDILVYFTNIITLLKVKVEFKSGETGVGVLYAIEKYFTRYLDVDMQQMANITVCPFPEMSVVTKSLARPGFVLLILTIWLTLYSITSLCEGVSMTRINIARKFRSFKLKLIEGYVETIKYSYSGLAGATFLLLTCVEIGGTFYWKYDANIECISSWQHVVIAFAVVYTVPFSVVTFLGIKLLQKRRIGHIQFMFACLLPLPFLLLWLIFYGIPRRRSPHIKVATSHFRKTSKLLLLGTKPLHLEKKEVNIDEKSNVILETFQGPYKNEYSSWEGVIELRKLLFNTYYLIENNIYRLVCCTITAVIISMHHNLVRPFKNTNSNLAEGLSLSLLCIACITNGIKTVFTESGILVEKNTPTEQLLFLMNRLDRILFLILLVYIIISESYLIIKEFKSRK